MRNGLARLFMKVLKACCLRNGEKKNKHIIAIAIDEDDEVHCEFLAAEISMNPGSGQSKQESYVIMLTEIGFTRV